MIARKAITNNLRQYWKRV